MRAHLAALSLQRTDTGSMHVLATRIGQQFQHVGVQHHLDVGRALQLGAIGLSEKHRAEHEIAIDQAIALEAGRAPRRCAPETARLEVMLIDGEQVARAGVVGFQFRVGDRPAAVRYPIARREVHPAQGNATAAPGIGAATERAQAAGGGVQIRIADRIARIEILCLGIAGHAAAHQQTDADRGIEVMARDGDAGGAGADDAQVGVEVLRSRGVAIVDQHARVFHWRRLPGFLIGIASTSREEPAH